MQCPYCSCCDNDDGWCLDCGSLITGGVKSIVSDATGKAQPEWLTYGTGPTSAKRCRVVLDETTLLEKKQRITERVSQQNAKLCGSLNLNPSNIEEVLDLICPPLCEIRIAYLAIMVSKKGACLRYISKHSGIQRGVISTYATKIGLKLPETVPEIIDKFSDILDMTSKSKQKIIDDFNKYDPDKMVFNGFSNTAISGALCIQHGININKLVEQLHISKGTIDNVLQRLEMIGQPVQKVNKEKADHPALATLTTEGRKAACMWLQNKNITPKEIVQTLKTVSLPTVRKAIKAAKLCD
tara:strand:+ start:13195 stop:14085 length:891 start_codon:yes stop_codon:yes gene_type:complete